MKKTAIGIAFCALSLMAAGCSEVEVNEAPLSDVNVLIERTPVTDETKCSVVFTPSDGTASYAYAIGADDEPVVNFENGTMATYTLVDSSEPSTVTFEDLTDGIYTVFAQAFDAEGRAGVVNILKVYMPDGIMSAQVQYATHESAGFTVNMPDNYIRYKYLFGKKEDRQAFVDETSENIAYVEERLVYTYNYFALEPSTEYAFFVQGVCRDGSLGEVIEVPVTTCAEGECPAVTLEYENDIYKGTYRLVLNDKCGLVGCGLMDKGLYDHVIANFKGDLMTMLNGWKDQNGGLVPGYGGKPNETLEVIEYTPEMLLDNPREIYAIVYDKELQMTGIQHFEFSSPAFDENAGTAEVTVEVKDVTASGATYVYKANEHTFGFFYETLVGDWYDKLTQSEIDGYYVHNYLFKQGFYWSYGEKEVEFTELKADPNTEYYACACPMNVNGPVEGGWGPIAVEPYTTLVK